MTTAAVTVAAMASFPALAAADPSPLVDNSVRSTNFGGTTLPTGFSATPWDAGMTGTGTVSGGNLTVNGARVDGQPTATLTAPQTLEFRGTFAPTVPNQHVGFGVTFSGGGDDGPSAIFTTGGGGGMSVVTRTAPTGGSEASKQIDLVLPTFNGALPHTYRIEWGASAVAYYIDGTLIDTHQLAISAPMRPVASDLTPMDADVVTLDWLTLGASSPATGTFDSRVLQANDPRAVWGSLTTTPASSGVTTFKTRTGNTPTPDSTWSAWQPVGNGGAIQRRGGQYIQYEAQLDSATANLDSVSIDYTTDTTGPAVAIDEPQVTGTSARITFSTQASDLARFECSVDGGAFAACSSPTQLTGLAAGSHTVSVRGFDDLGNQGSAVSKSFTIAAPAQGGGGGSQGSGNSTVDKTAPKVTFAATSLRASKRGTVGVKVGCPATETSCKITVQLMRGKTVAAKKTVTVKGGKTKTVTLQLTKAIRRQLSSHHSLKVTAVLSAKDAAGNKKTTKKSLTLRG
jgi:hypothetical protein